MYFISVDYPRERERERERERPSPPSSEDLSGHGERVRLVLSTKVDWKIHNGRLYLQINVTLSP